MRKTAAPLLFSIAMAEAFLRLGFLLVQNYDVEMWKYSQLLKRSVGDARSHVHRPGASARIMGVEVRINSKGLRGPEKAYDKPAGVYRVLVLGDSLTFGFGVAQDKTFCRRIEEALNRGPRRPAGRRYEVINAGVGNYGTAQELAYLRQEGYKYRPDHIILAFFINDAESAQKYRLNFLARHSMICVVGKLMARAWKVSRSPGRQYAAYYNSLYAGERWPRYKALLEEAADQAQALDAKLTVLLLPDLHELKDYPFAPIHQRIRRVFETRGCVVIDALEAFGGEGEPHRWWVARDDTHPNQEAHQVIAELVLQKIKL
ncbi:MAG: SGNH/GDSL hydrolase family protein [Elusimicrobia bacterium]|nr:SGNH/GDSL hydrolase family protein [Elusimicrobiota bacterium]